MSARWTNRAVSLVVGVLAACSPSGERRPAGTTADPVAVCARVADVCRLDGARLGVCTQASGDRCQGQAPCFVCMAQH